MRNTQYRVYREDDIFLYCGEPAFSVLDFWRFSYSQLLGQSETIAEFLVCQSLGIEKAENVNYWTAYDLSYKGKRIEVKATSYIHPWNRRVSNTRTFSIAPSNNAYWSELPGQRESPRLARQSEIYVFCLNTERNTKNPQPLNIDNWEFYVVPTYRINAYCERNGNPNQKTINLTVIKRIVGQATKFGELKETIEEAITWSDQHYLNS